MGAWRAWWRDTLLQGRRWFTLNLPGYEGVTPRVVRYLDVSQSLIGAGVYAVEARLELREANKLGPAPPFDPLYGLVTHLYQFDSAESTSGPFINSIAGGPSATISSTGGGVLLLPTANLIAGSERAVRASVRVAGGGVHLVTTRTATPEREPWCFDAMVKRLPDVGFEGSWENGGLLQWTNFAFYVRSNGTDGGAGPTGTAWQARFSLGGVVQIRGTHVLQVGELNHVAFSWSPVGETQGRWRCFINGELDFDLTNTSNNTIGGNTTMRIGPTSASTGVGTLPFELDMWRLTIGNARYTEPFTPPSSVADYQPQT